MAAPVISTSSSILGFKRNESFEFQPAATGTPETFAWSAVGLPSGVTIDTPASLAATGVASTDVITATGHTYANGDKVYFSALTGGTNLAVNTLYFVRDVSGSTFKLAATAGGTAIDFITDISAATVRKQGTGKISGSAATAGVYVVTVTATNADGSGSREFVIGIASDAAVSADANLDALVLEIVLPTCEARRPGVTEAATSTAEPAALLALKTGDVRMIILRYVGSDNTRLDPDPDTLKLTLRELDSESVLVTASDFEKVGTGATAEFYLPVDLTASAITGAVANYETDDPVTKFSAVAEVEWTREVTHNTDPLILRASTPTFRVRLERALTPN
jgi:hypothetical protein